MGYVFHIWTGSPRVGVPLGRNCIEIQSSTTTDPKVNKITITRWRTIRKSNKDWIF